MTRERDIPEELEFVFSYRSPFAWIAAHHVLPLLDPRVKVSFTPFFPLPDFENFEKDLVPPKARHNVRDIVRLCRAYGLRVTRPPLDEDDWSIGHGAFLHAERHGKGPEFALAMMDERWTRGSIVSEPDAVARVAGRVGLDEDRARAAAEDPALRSEVTELVRRNYDERDIFGVPMFVLPSGETFWGHHRMEWAIRYGYLPGRG